MDIVFIEGLRVNAVIGVFDWEKKVEQELVLDLKVSRGPSSNQAAARNDRISDAINYAAIADEVERFVKESRYDLVETLAEALAAKLLQDFRLMYLYLKLAKPSALANAGSVGVVIERFQDLGSLQ